MGWVDAGQIPHSSPILDGWITGDLILKSVPRGGAIEYCRKVKSPKIPTAIRTWSSGALIRALKPHKKNKGRKWPSPPPRRVYLLCASVLFGFLVSCLSSRSSAALQLAGLLVLHESQLIHYIMCNVCTYADSIRILNMMCIQSLGQRSNYCRSRKCIRWHIPVHAIFGPLA